MALCTQNRCADQTALHLVSPPEAYRSARSMNTRTELAHPFGHRGARTNPSNQPLFFLICLPHYTAFCLLLSLEFPNPARSRLRVLWTLRPLRSGFEPLTQGFSVLCSNQLSYLNHFPKVCFLHRIAPYLTTLLVREKPLTNMLGLFSLVRQAFEQLFQLPPNLPTCSRTESRPGTGRPEEIERR